jgi:hypothetical protein
MTPDADQAGAYRSLGWQIDEEDGRLHLVTGTAVDALEIPRTPGILAAMWWLYTDGAPDDVRGLPSMPPPGEAMAVITAGDQSFFLAEAGAFPWTTQDPVVTHVSTRTNQPVIRWHSGGSRIPFPPSRTDEGQDAWWAHVPSRGMRLTSPAVLLHLLGRATALLGHSPHMLALPDDVLAIPALGNASGQARPQLTVVPPRPTIPFGFQRGH